MQDGTPIDHQTLARRWRRAEAERPALLRLARGRGLSAEDAEDCVQEAMMRVVPRPDLDEPRLGALLTTVVVRLAIDQHRRARTATGAVERAAAGLAPTAECDPAAVVCNREEARWTARLVDRLPAAQRAALWARADGRPVGEIARDMATSPKAVESLIARARAAARSAMASSLAAVYALARRLRLYSIDAGATAAAAAVVAALTMPAFGAAPAGGQVDAAAGFDRGRDAATGPPPAVPHDGRAAPSPATAPPPNRGGRRGGAPGGSAPPNNGYTPIQTVSVGGGSVSVGHRPSDETYEQKVMDCVNYGPTLGLHDDTFPPRRDDGHVCRTEPGSVVWR